MHFDDGELNEAERADLLDVQFADIDACRDKTQLRAWYFGFREIADDVISQIEANSETGVRDSDWEARAYRVIVIAKKRMKRILRHCDQHGFERPDGEHQRLRDTITRLTAQLQNAKGAERDMVIRWLTSGVTGSPEELAERLRGKQHVAFARAATLFGEAA